MLSSWLAWTQSRAGALERVCFPFGCHEMLCLPHEMHTLDFQHARKAALANENEHT